MVTTGCGDACPNVPGHFYLDWPVADPDGLDPAVVRPIRNDIERHVRAELEDLLDDLDVTTHA